MTEKDKKYEENKREFLETVFTPEQFQKDCDAIESGMNMRKAEDYTRYWTEDLRGDTSTMERIIETYMGGEVLAGFILTKSIRVIEGKDSAYFEGLYGRLTNIDNPEGFRGHWHAREAAIGRVTNQDFLKRVVDAYPADLYSRCDSPEATAVSHITDKAYLRKVAETYKDSFIVEAAQRALGK